jgi:hypothetical protein
VGVTAQAVGRLEQRDLVTLAQQPRAGQARDPGTDDGDPLGLGLARLGGEREELGLHRSLLASSARVVSMRVTVDAASRMDASDGIFRA